MTPPSLLAELRRLGITLIAQGDVIRYRPREAVSADLLGELRRHKTALLRLLPDYQALYQRLTSGFGTAEDLAAIEWFAALNGDRIIAEIRFMDRRCDDLARAGADDVTYRAAVTVLVARLQQIRDWHRAAQSTETDTVAAAPIGPWQLRMERNQPVREPIRLDTGVVVEDVPHFIGHLVTALEFVVAKKNLGREPGFSDLVDVYASQLAMCGVTVRVEVVS
jgi:hypothetical protein